MLIIFVASVGAKITGALHNDLLFFCEPMCFCASFCLYSDCLFLPLPESFGMNFPAQPALLFYSSVAFLLFVRY